jgi:hypothetical protein
MSSTLMIPLDIAEPLTDDNAGVSYPSTLFSCLVSTI